MERIQTLLIEVIIIALISIPIAFLWNTCVAPAVGGNPVEWLFAMGAVLWFKLVGSMLPSTVSPPPTVLVMPSFEYEDGEPEEGPEEG